MFLRGTSVVDDRICPLTRFDFCPVPPSTHLETMTASKALKLNPEAVRRRCEDIPDCMELPQDKRHPNCLSFLVGAESGSVEKVCRITIYCETGTVATARVMEYANNNDENKVPDVRQAFQRNVTSLDVVERLIRHPPVLTRLDSSLIANFETEDESKAIRSNLELIDVSIAVLQSECDKLNGHMKSLEPSTPSELNHRLDRGPEGMEFQFSLPADPMKHVDQCLRDINGMGRLVKGVSTNGRGTVFLYGNGGVAYTPSIPRALYHKLSQLRKTKDRDSRPSYISLGTRDRFFVSFHDGTFAFKGPKGLDREIRKARKQPASIAFGSSYDAFFIVYTDGSWVYQGRGIPAELEEKLSGRQDRPDLVCVNLGPAGEWFLRARNGRLWWGGISDEMTESIQALLDDGHFLNFLDFGDDGSYFISYDIGTQGGSKDK